MSVALSIAFTGLCALVADGNGKPAQILLVDAKGIGEVQGIILPAHAPTLVVSLRDLANPDTSRPTRVIVAPPVQASGGTREGSDPQQRGELDQLGLWDLAGAEVRIRAQGTSTPGVHLFQPSPEETSWPLAPGDSGNASSWRDLRYVADMRAISGDGRIEPALMGQDEAGPVPLPSAIAARVRLDVGRIQAGVPSQELYRNDLFEFRASASEHGPRQALTDTIEWSLESEAGAVVIEIVPSNGGPTRRLLLAPSATPHRLFISNLPVETEAHADSMHAMSDEEMNALHFGVFYKLLRDPSNRPLLPELWRPRDRKGAGMVRPAFCPPARFTSE